MTAEKPKEYTTRERFSRWLVLILVLMLAFGPFSFPSDNFFLPSVGVKQARAVASSTSFTAAGNATWTVPTNISPATATIELWGGGGAGGGATANPGAGCGGAGGSYTILNSTSVTAGTGYNVIVAATSTGQTTSSAVQAASSSFNGATAVAVGGNRGGTDSACVAATGTTAGNVGTTFFAGGNGGRSSSTGAGGGGGGGAGSTGAGGNGATSTAGTGTANNGGDGGAGSTSAATGNPGKLAGGGGAGAKTSTGADRPGGDGAIGLVLISYNIGQITLANGTQPAGVTIAPEASAATSSVFTFQTDNGTSTITNVTTTVSTSSGIYQIQITNSTGATVYGSSTNPSTVTSNISLSGMNVSTTLITFKIFIVPLTHANMPAVPGGTYVVTSTITDWLDTRTFLEAGSNTTSSPITIDNASPGEVTATSTTPVSTSQIDLAWTNPGDGDFSNLVIVRATSSAVTGNPTEGASPSSGDTIGNGIVMYTGSGTSVSNTGLSENTTYFYKIWAKDTLGNYSANGVDLTATTNAAATPKIRTAANETFSISSSSVAIASITVTSTAASQITAANDIRITISTGTTNFRWDTSDTLATISGTGDVSSTVSYEDASSTLVVNVLTDFANASSVTISDLSYRDFNSINAATTTFDLKWQGAGQAPPFSRAASTTVTIKGRLEANQHSAGQVTNQFPTSSTATNKQLFAFQLLPTGESASTTLIVQLSSITGIVSGDIAGAQIFKDTNANGTLDGGETTTIFGTGSVSIAGTTTGTIAFSTLGNVASATSTRYIMTATTTNLLVGDTMIIGLGASNVSATGTTIGVSLNPTSTSAISNAIHTTPAVSRTQRSYKWQNDDGTDVNSNTAVAAADTAVTGVKIGQRLTLRMQVDNDGGGEAAGIAYRLQFQVNSTSGSWTDVASGNAIQASLGLAGADAAAITTSTAAVNSRTFVNGTWHENTSVSAGTTVLTNARFTELGYMIETSNAASSTTYYFRVANNSGPTALDGYSSFPSLTTVTNANDTLRYSKQAGSLYGSTSSLTYFFDKSDYDGVATSSDSALSTSTAAANIPSFNFRIRNSSSAYPLKFTWTGQYSAASTTFIDVYNFGSGAWQNLNSTSTPSINTNFTLFGNATATPTNFYQADGSNFWSYFGARQATTTGSLKADFVSVAQQPTADSTADQSFDVNQATTSISQIRIVAPNSSVITSASDIRIKIPTSLNMSWATSTTVVTLGGSASGNVSTTVSYPDDKTLLLDVTTGFAAADDLTISGLSFKNFTAASATSTLQALYGGSTSTVDAADGKIKRIRGTYALNSNAGGQQANKFDIGGTSLTAAQLLNFQLAPTGENATTTQLVIDLLNNFGFAAANITNAQLAVDTNGNGTIDAGESATVGGTGSVSLSGGSGSITFSSAFSVTSTAMNLVLRADVASINFENVLKFQIQTSGITANGQVSLVTLSPSGSTLSATHSKPSNKGGGGGGGSPPPFAANVGGGGSGGGAPPGGTTSPPPPVSGGGSGGGGGQAP